MGVKLALILMEQLRLTMFKNRVLSKIFRSKSVEMTQCITRNFVFCPPHQIILG